MKHSKATFRHLNKREESSSVNVYLGLLYFKHLNWGDEILAATKRVGSLLGKTDYPKLQLFIFPLQCPRSY